MRQVAIVRHGPPEVLRIRERPDPVPRAGEVRIRVAASGVNFADVMARVGLYPDAPRPPTVVGYEVAGAVDAIGPDVSGMRIGDRVLAFTRFGGYATAVVVPVWSVVPIAPGLTDVEAAAIPVNYLTAFIALYRMANVSAGESVLVYGAGGGVGIAATQLAKRRHAVVIGAASAAKLDAIRSIGADHVVDRQRRDFRSELRRVVGDRGADVVLDPIGGRNFALSYSLLAPLGRLVLYGVSSLASGERRSLWHTAWTLLAMPSFRPLSLMNHNRAVFGLNVGHLWNDREQLRAAMELLLQEISIGGLRPVIARTFPLERAADAHRYLQSRANIGKVVLTTGVSSS
jgi:NADPH:quinone reductase-like Zn-dependent oxidoreductase